MGTHISRVKSVDLDSWTDEQLQSVLKWGNARANKYWEAKLTPGHVPSEAKIENFIRTKYELKRWVMDGPMPDPETLDTEGDDDVPLSVVKDKQEVERRESLRKASIGQKAAPQADLIGADPVPAPAAAPPLRAASTGPTVMHVPPKADPAPPKATSTKDSLLGLDFLGAAPAAPPRPASTTGTPSSGQSRPDLKQSILSLYATAPRPQPQPVAQASHSASSSLSGLSSPGLGQTQGSLGGLNDAFSSLSFGSATSPKPAQTDAFAALGSLATSKPAAKSNTSSFSGLSGGSFFDSKPAASNHQQKQSVGSSSLWGSTSPSTTSAKPAAAPASSALGDLFDLSDPTPSLAQPSLTPATATSTTTTTTTTSVFNLSQPKPSTTTSTTATTSSTTNPLGSLTSNAWAGGSDVWGGNAWATPDPAPAEPAKPATTSTSSDLGWASLASKPIVPGASGGFAPKVAADEEFGGWTSSTTTTSPSKPGTGAGFPGSEDLFSNVWQ
jgi:stromal membrane-associated protein